MGTVCLLVGVPGSGKSTWINSFIQDSNYVVCSADHYFLQEGKYTFNPSKLPQAHASCFNKFRQAMAEGVSMIFIDNTNILAEHRAPYEQAANEFGYEVITQVFDVDPQIAFERNVHEVPFSSIQRMHLSLKQQGLVH